MSEAIPTHWKVKAMERAVRGAEDAHFGNERYGTPEAIKTSAAYLNTLKAILLDYQAQEANEHLSAKRKRSAANG